MAQTSGTAKSVGEPHQNYESPATVKIFDLAPYLSLQYYKPNQLLKQVKINITVN
jgi:hypothetical protein